MSSPTNSAASSPIKSRRTSSTASNESTLSHHELEYMSLRDENLSYEDDVDFHIFIDAMDRVDSLVTERVPRRGRKESIGRLFNGLNNKLRRDSTSTPAATCFFQLNEKVRTLMTNSWNSFASTNAICRQGVRTDNTISYDR
ncbi:hypothetical protein IWW34DRAFT_803013 [Fusarium oxysporum f. sp. albedinis]|nr:hypothetical protein IWW34DRAFT_803013 [Fusarium oxysporum f. sp. albedinis]